MRNFKVIKNEEIETTAISMSGMSNICSSYDGDMGLMPVMASRVSAGEPTEMTEEVAEYTEFSTQFFSGIKDTIIVQVQGSSMTNANIDDGDFLLVDDTIAPQNGSIVIVGINGEITVKRFVKKEQSISLLPENPNFEPIEVTIDDTP